MQRNSMNYLLILYFMANLMPCATSKILTTHFRIAIDGCPNNSATSTDFYVSTQVRSRSYCFATCSLDDFCKYVQFDDTSRLCVMFNSTNPCPSTGGTPLNVYHNKKQEVQMTDESNTSTLTTEVSTTVPDEAIPTATTTGMSPTAPDEAITTTANMIEISTPILEETTTAATTTEMSTNVPEEATTAATTTDISPTAPDETNITKTTTEMSTTIPMETTTTATTTEMSTTVPDEATTTSTTAGMSTTVPDEATTTATMFKTTTRANTVAGQISGCQIDVNMADSFRGEFGGLREIQPDISKPSFQVKCTPTVGLLPMSTLATVIQQNLYQDRVFFDRTIQEFKDGFGDVAGDHFIGLDKIHLMTSSSAYDMIMAMVNIYGSDLDFDKYIYMKYYNFQISDFSKNYKMSVSSSGALFNDYYDQLEYLNGTSFSTKDDDNDGFKSMNCAAVNYHGFWYNSACNGCDFTGLPCYLDNRVIVTMALIPHNAW